MERFNKDGRMIIPISEREKKVPEEKENSVRYVVNHAYCPKGCSIIDTNNLINGYPSLRIKFKRKGNEGIMLLSAVEGIFDKIIESGNLENGVKDELYCPHCGTIFEKLVNCSCKTDADMIVIGLTPKLDFNNAITFCNVTGCKNGTFVQAGHIIRHIRLNEGY
ncbi:MAG: hypothetical protein JXB49_22300 [Bacteroidales bacterium]|nr:hypothetical protein [Bacteroidales bacterium]